jgi:hypothetical protein
MSSLRCDLSHPPQWYSYRRTSGVADLRLGQIDRLGTPRQWYRSVSRLRRKSTLACATDGCFARRCRRWNGWPPSLRHKSGELATVPHGYGVPNCNLTRAPPPNHDAFSHHILAYHDPDRHHTLLSIAHSFRHGQHQLADNQHRCLGPRQPRQLRPKLPHSRRCARIDGRCPKQCPENPATATRW